MQITIRGKKTHAVECEEDKTVRDLKELIANCELIAVDDQLLYTCGTPLEDDAAVVGAVVLANSVDVNVAVKGGKVHGSLARAGKVRGQTPKTEKKEKKKPKTGRAKRRLLYNRRFISVVPTFGKRRGPNSNS